MSDQTTYKPLINATNDFKLADTSRGTEKELHKIQVRFAGNELEQRKLICQMENWEPQEHIPELSRSTRISIDALAAMRKRVGDDTARLAKELDQLIEDYQKDVEPVPFIGADDYWLKLANLLLKGFEGFADGKQISADELNFKELQRAYNDFF